jgi:hypothetical protein
MHRASLRSKFLAAILLACMGSCGFLLYSLSGIYRTTPASDLVTLARSCTDSVYNVQYCLGLVPTVPSMYPSLYRSESSP